MELNSYHVSRSVAKTASFIILTRHNIFTELLLIYPMHFADYFERGNHPPTVAHILQLFGTSVESARGQLPFGQPPAEQIDIEQMQTVQNRQKAHTAVDLEICYKLCFYRFFFKFVFSSTWPACDSAPGTHPNPPSKFKHLSTKAKAVSLLIRSKEFL